MRKLLVCMLEVISLLVSEDYNLKVVHQTAACSQSVNQSFNQSFDHAIIHSIKGGLIILFT